MNKTLAITTIALVAVVMGLSVIATAIPMANAAVGCPADPPKGFWSLVSANTFTYGDKVDRNGDGLICLLTIKASQAPFVGGVVDNRF